MFNLFGKKEKAPVETLVADMPVTKSKYPKVVEDIHNEFFTAGDNILQEATCLLKELEQKDLAKGKRLAALGFNKTREAVAAIETENKLATTKEIADLVMYYRVNYPNNKFITEEQVKQICEKYGLVLGESALYKGFVPESKLSIIEKFTVKENDIQKMTFLVLDRNDKVLGKIYYDDLSDSGKRYFGSVEGYSYITGGDGIYVAGCSSLFTKSVYINYKDKEYVKAQKVQHDSSLFICAPAKEMDTTGLDIKGYTLAKHIPDPVVLQPVRGGYLIVCAWGDEATDEIVVNQTHN